MSIFDNIRLGDALQDIRYAFRIFRRAPSFSITVVLMLSLGMGANIASFSVLDALLLRMLPVTEPGRLFRMVGAARDAGAPSTNVSFKVFEEMKHRASRFANLMAYSSANERMIRTGGSEEEQLVQQTVSRNYFQVLGVKPAIGRFISPGDDAQHGQHQVAVISYSVWSRQFGRSPEVLGRRLTFQNRTFEIAGVTPPGFFGVEVGKAVDVWTPVATAPAENLTDDHFAWLQIMGRLRPGVTIAQASAPIEAVLNEFMLNDVRQHAPPGTPARIIQRFLSDMRIKGVAAGGGISYLRRAYRRPLQIMMFVVGLVLLIACTSVANLLIARGSARQQEIAVRLSLGARRARVLQQLITESLLLGLMAAITALLLAYWATPVLVRMLAPSDNPAQLDTRIDMRLLLFMGGLSITTVLLCGIVPALRLSNAEIYSALKSGGRLIQSGRTHARRCLVTGQIALSLVLVVSAVLFTRTLLNLNSQHLGFHPERVLVARLGQQGLTTEQSVRTWGELLRHVRALAGVEEASLSSASLFSGNRDSIGVRTAIAATNPADPTTGILFISTDYFRTLGIRLLSGRDFELRDNDAFTPSAVVVNEAFCRKFLGRTTPIGQKLTKLANAPKWAEIVGVVSDTKYSDVRETPPPMLYVPYGRIGEWMDAPGAHPAAFMSLDVRGYQTAGSLKADLRREARPRFAVLEISPQRELINDTLIRQKLLANVTDLFGGLALLLAVLGLYGLMSYTVAQRRQELGIRMALGAEPFSLLALILRDSALMIGAGIAIGGVLALTTAHLARTLLYGLTPNDPQSFAIAAGALIFASLLAALLPAYRASATDPMTALRHE